MSFRASVVCSDFFGIGYTLCLSDNGEVYHFGSLGYREEEEEIVFPPRKISCLK